MNGHRKSRFLWEPATGEISLWIASPEDIDLPWQSLDDAGSRGFVSFKARPRSGVPQGTSIENQASITFDFNAPIDTSVVTTRIGAPVSADAGPDQTVLEGSLVTLDGSASSDPDLASYSWERTAGPAVNLSDIHAVKPTFTAPRIADPDPAAQASITFRLTVTDSRDAAATDEVSVAVKNHPGGGQVPVDANQDGQFDLSDGLAILGFLFEEWTAPCGAEGTSALLDANGDGHVDLSDVVGALSYLFLAGPPPSLGVTRTPISDCPQACPR